MSARARGFAALLLWVAAAPSLAIDYVPPRGAWAGREPAAAGFDPAKLAAAVALAQRSTVAEPADLRRVIVEHYTPREPDYRVLGPTGIRSGGSGMVVRGGYVVAQWVAAMLAPSKPRADYGLLWWLNTERKAIPAAPATAFWAAGFGGNYVYVDRDHDLVIVLRWVPEFEPVIGAIVSALRD